MDFHYIDRPAVPATQQIAVNVSGIIEQGVSISLADVSPLWYASAVEVRNADGIVTGTLLYVPSVDFAKVVSPEGLHAEELTSEPAPTQEQYSFLGVTAPVDPETANALDNIEEYITNADVEDEVTVPQSFLEEIGLCIMGLQKRNNNQYELLTAKTHGEDAEDEDDEIS